jgi:hypothetical protein
VDRCTVVMENTMQLLLYGSRLQRPVYGHCSMTLQVIMLQSWLITVACSVFLHSDVFSSENVSYYGHACN